MEGFTDNPTVCLFIMFPVEKTCYFTICHGWSRQCSQFSDLISGNDEHLDAPKTIPTWGSNSLGSAASIIWSGLIYIILYIIIVIYIIIYIIIYNYISDIYIRTEYHFAFLIYDWNKLGNLTKKQRSQKILKKLKIHQWNIINLIKSCCFLFTIQKV